MEATPRHVAAVRRPRARVLYCRCIPDSFPSLMPFNHRSTTALYPLAAVKSALRKYVDKHDPVNCFEQRYINISSDAVFSAALYGSPNTEGATPAPEFAKREAALSALCKPHAVVVPHRSRRRRAYHEEGCAASDRGDCEDQAGPPRQELHARHGVWAVPTFAGRLCR